MGIGFVLCLREEELGKLQKILKVKKEKFHVIGRVINEPEFIVL